MPRRALAKQAPANLPRNIAVHVVHVVRKLCDVRTTEIPRAVGSNGHLRTILDHQKRQARCVYLSNCRWGVLAERYCQGEGRGFESRHPLQERCRSGCGVSVPKRHSGSGTYTTLSGHGSGSWATLAPVARRHAIRPCGAPSIFTVVSHVQSEGGRQHAGGAGSRGTAE